MRVVFKSTDAKTEIKTKNKDKLEWFISLVDVSLYKDGSNAIKIYKGSRLVKEAWMSHDKYMEMFNKWFDYKKDSGNADMV